MLLLELVAAYAAGVLTWGVVKPLLGKLFSKAEDEVKKL